MIPALPPVLASFRTLFRSRAALQAEVFAVIYNQMGSDAT
jgi:hypothetical protein